MTKSRVFFWLLVAFIGGVAIASFVRVPMIAVGAVFIFGSALIGLGIARAERGRILGVIGFSLLVFAFGIFWYIRSEESRILAPSLAQRDAALPIEGTVAEEPARSSKSQRFVIREQKSDSRILVLTRPYPEYHYGDRVRLLGALSSPENFSDSFDYVGYLAKDNIFHEMRFPEIEFLGAGGGSRVLATLFRIKAAFAARLEALIPEPQASFLIGLILGERKSFPAELSENLRITGTTHLVALSGYNITIVGDSLFRALTFFFIPYEAAFVLSIVGITLFTAMTGAAASVVRAAIMGILVLIARREGRQYRMRNALTLAAAVMLYANPKILRFDVAFQLSFLATLGLLYGTPLVDAAYDRIKWRVLLFLRDWRVIRLRREAPPQHAPRSLLRGTLVPTFAAQLFVLPLLVYQFGRLSFISPLANLFVVPLIPATMFFGFLAGAIAFLGEWLGRIAAFPAILFLFYELGAINFFARFPHASVAVGTGAFLLLCALYLVVAFFILRKRFHGRH